MHNIENINFVAMFRRYKWTISDEKIEEVIKALSNSESALEYTLQMGKRWREAETVILNEGEALTAYEYALHVIGGRWRKAEPIIAKDLETAFFYAQNVICGRWPKIEPIIMKDPYYASMYIKEVLRK
jgi:hypothetical protein